MTERLHYSIPRFIDQKLTEHSHVSEFWKKNTDDGLVYNIGRTGNLDPIEVLASSAYLFTLTSFYQIPERINYILVARPEAKYNSEVVEEAMKVEIGIGKIGGFLGALRHERIWIYVPQERRIHDKNLGVFG